MPIKSRAQLRKFGALAGRGEISERKFKHFRDVTPDISGLPERVTEPNKTPRGKKRIRTVASKMLRNNKFK